MCRLAAYPPGCSKADAIKIMKAFSSSNNDGVGTAYVKDGRFILKKYKIPFMDALTQDKDLFDHMPYDGWTIAHVRMATTGKIAYENTHPLEIIDTVMCHNGCWQPHELVRSMTKGYKYKGETDSEVAGYMIESMGVPEFYNWKYSTGVYLQLKRDGSFTAMKCTGELNVCQYKDSFLFASQISGDYDSIDLPNGYITFDPKGVCTGNHFAAKEITLRKDYSGKKVLVHSNELWNKSRPEY